MHNKKKKFILIVLHFTSHWGMCLEKTKQWKKLSLSLHGKSHSALEATEGKTCYAGMKGTVKQEWELFHVLAPSHTLICSYRLLTTTQISLWRGLPCWAMRALGNILLLDPKFHIPHRDVLEGAHRLCCKCPPCQHASFPIHSSALPF